jgi:hypothetical protein
MRRYGYARRDLHRRPAPFLAIVLTAASVDWTLKAVAHWQQPSTLTFHAVTHPAGVWVVSLLLLVVTALASPPAGRPSWVYGSGLAWGGAVANMVEIGTRGGATDFSSVGAYVANPAAIVGGLALWWCSARSWAVSCVRRRKRLTH